MSCKVKQRALDTFEQEGATKNGIVQDFDKFDKLNAEFTKTANEKYNVGTGNTDLFSVSMDTSELTVIPNDMLLDALDKSVREYNEIVGEETISDVPANLFGLDTQNKDRLEFHVNTINVVTNFLDKIGIEQKLVSNILSSDGNVVKGAQAAAKFMEGTIEWSNSARERILNNDKLTQKEKDAQIAAYWSKLPEETAHWWFRLLKTNTTLKEALRNTKQLADKNEELFAGAYGKVANKAEDLTEESIGQLIAEAMKRIETKNAAAKDYSFLKKFLEWINSIINFWTDNEADPYEVAAMKILAHDMSDLMSMEEYKAMYNIVDFTEELTEAATAEDSEPENLDTVSETDKFFDRLLNKTFKKKTRFLKKTLKKHYAILDNSVTSRLPGFEGGDNLNPLTRKLFQAQKENLEDTTGYHNVSPTLRALPNLLQKYRKNPIPMNSPTKLDGAKKQELAIIDNVKAMILAENPDMKSISAEDLTNEVHAWLEANYLLGFANETAYLTYRVDDTFKPGKKLPAIGEVDERLTGFGDLDEFMGPNLPFDIHHNKVSIRFNDTYHVKRTHFNMSPSAWGNLTYFYTGKNEYKDAVLLHEIQNDNIETIRESLDKTVDIEEAVGKYLQGLNEELLNNISRIENGGKELVSITRGQVSTAKSHIIIHSMFRTMIDDNEFDGVWERYKESMREDVNLFEQRPIILDRLQEFIDAAYTRRRVIQDIKNKGGLAAFLKPEELTELQNIIDEIEDAPGTVPYKRERFKRETTPINNILQDRVAEKYGDTNTPYIEFQIMARPRTPQERRAGILDSGKLNTNLKWMLTHTHNKLMSKANKQIAMDKMEYINGIKQVNHYEFTKKFLELSRDQVMALADNYAHNEALLDRLINEDAQAQLKADKTSKENIEDVTERVSEQVTISEGLKADALAQQEVLRKKYGDFKAETEKILEMETNYFTPLVHHLIQKHIKEHGKDMPMYFSGYNITKLTQGSTRTAWIYAGKDEIETVSRKSFTYNKTIYSLREDGIGGEIIPTKIDPLTQKSVEISESEYEKAHMAAIKDYADDVKFDTAVKLGIASPTTPRAEALKRLNEFKKESTFNMDRYMNAIIGISGGKPIETGAIYNMMSQVAGIKLVWQRSIDGIRNNAGGYLVDLTNYEYETPVLYALEEESKVESLRDDTKQPILSYIPVEKEHSDSVANEVDYTSMNSIILFGAESDNPKYAAEILANIRTNFPDFNENTSFLLNKVVPILGRTNAKIRFVQESELKASDTFMQYNAGNNEIQIAKSRFKDASPEFVIQAFLHEVAHSVTANAYLRPVTMEDFMFRDFIDEQFTKYAKLAKVEQYGLTNPMEFMAEAISNKDFQDYMRSLDAVGDTFWSKLVDMIRMLFGVPRRPDFNRIVDSITTIVDNADRSFNGIKEASEIYEFKQDKPDVPSLKTTEEKAARLLELAMDNLRQAAKRVKVKGKNRQSQQRAKDFRKHLNELREKMEHLSEKAQFHSILLYVKSLRSTVNSLKERLDKTNKESGDFIEVANHFQQYLDTYDLIEDINKLLSEARADKDLSDKDRNDVDKVREALATFSQDHKDLINDIATYKKEALIPLIAFKENFPEIEYKWTQKFAKEYDKDTANGLSKSEWITQQLLDHDDDIQLDIEDAARSMSTDLVEDISEPEARLSDPLNANSSKIFQLAVGIVAQMRNRINTAVLDFEFVLDDLFKKLKADGKSMTSNKRYKHMLQQDLDGNYYLLGEYHPEWKQRYEQDYLGLKQELADLRFEAESMGMTNKEIMEAPDYREIIDQMRAWEKEHTVGVGDGMKPHPKYKNDLSVLTPAEKEFLEEFNKVNLLNGKKFGKKGSLRTRVRGVVFNRIPAITKSNHERLLELDGKGILKENFQDMTQVRPDDIGFQEEALDGKDRPIKDVRIHFRGSVDPNQQSIDLPTLLRLEYLNGVNYKEKSQTKIVLNELVEISGNKKYIATSERTGGWLVNLFRKNKTVAEMDGKDSITYKRMKSYIDTQIHDILNVHAGFSIAGADVNKITQTISSYTAVLGMAANVASGTVNVLNGFTQMYIETFGGNHINIKSLTKAEGMYFRDMPNILADLGRPVKKSVTNQINQMFDIFGGFSVAEQAFFKNNIAKRLATFGTTSAMQDMGEHMMQSILAMAVLDGLKVMNGDGRFINKKGEVVPEKDAASMLDMMKIHESGKLFVDENAYFTTHTRNIDFYEGGQAHISLLIKKKIFDTAGVYDSNFQPDIYRNWYGKMLLLFKRFLMSQMQNRWQGFQTIHKKKEDLTDSDIQFNIGIKERVEGTHVTALRLFIGSPNESLKIYYKDGIIPMLKSLKLAHLPENFKNLSDYEKANLRKVTADLLTTAVLLPALSMLIESIAEGGDDDDDMIWFLAYIVRRLESELSQFRNPAEAWRITEQPVAGTRVITNGLSFLTKLFSFWGWTEEDSNGNNKLLKSGEKMVPIWIQFKKEWKDSLKYIENQAN